VLKICYFTVRMTDTTLDKYSLTPVLHYTNYQNKPVFSLISLVNMTLPAFSAVCPAVVSLLLSAGACYRSIFPARGVLSSKPAGGCCCCRLM